MDSAQCEDNFFQFLFEFSVPDHPKGDGYRLMPHLSSASQELLCLSVFLHAKIQSPLAVSQEGIFPM